MRVGLRHKLADDHKDLRMSSRVASTCWIPQTPAGLDTCVWHVVHARSRRSRKHASCTTGAQETKSVRHYGEGANAHCSNVQHVALVRRGPTRGGIEHHCDSYHRCLSQSTSHTCRRSNRQRTHQRLRHIVPACASDTNPTIPDDPENPRRKI